MGSSIRRFTGLTTCSDLPPWLIAAVSAAPLEDTADVKAAKAEFKAAFDMVEAGEHIQLAPVNNDVQAEPIAQFYLADAEDVAAAKAEFKAAFDDAAAGGLAANRLLLQFTLFPLCLSTMPCPPMLPTPTLPTPTPTPMALIPMPTTMEPIPMPTTMELTPTACPTPTPSSPPPLRSSLSKLKVL